MKMSRYIYIMALLLLFISCHSESVDLDLFDPDTEQEGGDGMTGDGVREMEFTLAASARFVELFSTQLSSTGENDVTVKSANVHFSGRDSAGDYVVMAVVLYANSEFQVIFEDSDDLTFVPLDASYMIRYFEFVEDNGTSDGLIPVGVICDISSSGVATIVSTIGEDYNGAGLSEDPYIIATSSDFNELIGEKLSSGNLYGVYFEQGASIDGSQLEYVKCEFDGHYSGGSIDGDINNTISSLSSPLFYKLTSNATVKDLTLTDLFIYTASTDEGVGALAVTASGADITNVKVLGGNVVGYKNVGGFVGDGYATFDSCYNYVNVTTIESGGNAIGGYLGDAHYGTTLTFRDCVYRGDINASGSDNVGGLVGYDYSDALSISSCYVSGLISGRSCTGGLIGKTSAVKTINISDSSVGKSIQINSSGAVTQTVIIRGSESSVGGLIGQIWEATDYSGTVTISNTTLESSSSTDITYTVTGASDDVGSIGGMVGSAYKIAFDGCSFTNNGARIGSSEYAHTNVGGVIGYGEDLSFNDSQFTNYGIVDTSGSYAGGVVGLLYLTNDYGTSFTGNIFTNNAPTVSGGSSVGGCIGSLHEEDGDEMHEIQMLNNGSVSGANYVGGISGYIYTNGFIDLSDSGMFTDENYTSGYVAGAKYVGGYYGKLNIGSDVPIGSNISYIDVFFKNSSKITVSGSDDDVGGLIGLCTVGGSVKSRVLIEVKDYQYLDVSGVNNVGGCVGHVICSTDNLTACVDVITFENIQGGISSGEYDRDGLVNASGHNVGGIVGYYSDSYYNDTNNVQRLTFTNCYNMIAVQGSGSDSYNVGGIIGYAANLVDIDQCCNLADITSAGEGSSGSGASVGGIVGRMRNIKSVDSNGVEEEDETIDLKHNITSCYNMGYICDMNESKQRGGILGYARCAVTISDCFNAGSVPSGGDYVAGIVGCFSNISNEDYRYTVTNCYNIGQTGWGIVGGDNDLNNHELDRESCYYYSGSASGDIDTNHSGSSTSYSKDDMNSKLSFSNDNGVWTDAGPSSVPYLKNLYYDDYPVIDY